MTTIKKPITLRVIFILNALMMILPFIFFLVIKKKGIEIGGIEPVWMIYTGVAYMLSFAALVLTILKRKIHLLRGMILLNVLIALPVKAYLGILVAIISMVLSFTKKVKDYFGQK